jgi:hypothetical protein
VADKPKKKVVHVTHTTAGGETGATWTPSTEAKGKATGLRVFAWILWLLAIGIEAAEILWVLKQDPVNMTYLIAGIVLIAILASVGSVLWKKANRADPASRSEPIRFFVQNQLGAIMTMLAFLPLIIMIFLNKDMDSKQKGIAGGIAVVLGLIAVLVFGVDYNPFSVEDYTAQNLTCAQLPADTPADEVATCNTDVATVTQLTGKDQVTWTKSGDVYHLCEAASDVNLESEDNTIYTGTVADAITEGKDRLTLKVDQEIEQCGLTADAPA